MTIGPAATAGGVTASHQIMPGRYAQGAMMVARPTAIGRPYNTPSAAGAPMRLPKHRQPAIIDGKVGSTPKYRTVPVMIQASKKPKLVPVPNTCGFVASTRCTHNGRTGKMLLQCADSVITQPHGHCYAIALNAGRQPVVRVNGVVCRVGPQMIPITR